MKTILVPIDFSPVSKSVLAKAIELARECQGRIVLAHVVAPPTPFMDYGLMNYDLTDMLTASEESARRLLAQWQARTERSGVPLKTMEAVGFPAVQILRLAQKVRAAYIVIGSHGHTAFYDLVVGSTASGILKNSTCPVVVVPARKKRARAKR